MATVIIIVMGDVSTGVYGRFYDSQKFSINADSKVNICIYCCFFNLGLYIISMNPKANCLGISYFKEVILNEKNLTCSNCGTMFLTNELDEPFCYDCHENDATESQIIKEYYYKPSP